MQFNNRRRLKKGEGVYYVYLINMVDLYQVKNFGQIINMSINLNEKILILLYFSNF